MSVFAGQPTLVCSCVEERHDFVLIPPAVVSMSVLFYFDVLRDLSGHKTSVLLDAASWINSKENTESLCRSFRTFPRESFIRVEMVQIYRSTDTFTV